MGFLSGMFSSVVKVALTPIAVAKDVVNVAIGDEADATKDLLQSAVDDVYEATDDLGDGEFL